jgi:isoquinoline 1-oxidoreductase beta subunit
MKRRQFLHAAALGAGGLALCFRAQGDEIVVSHVASDGGASRGGAQHGLAPLGDYLRIAPDGSVSFRLIKHEMGQGIATALAQIACDELCADWDKVQIEFGHADLERFQNEAHGGYDTGGSATIASQYERMRKVGATARQMLESAAAEAWGVAVDQCRAERHSVVHRASSRELGFGELAAAAARLPVPTKVRLDGKRAMSLIGQPKPSKLAPAIASGRLEYGIDVQRPGMLYAVIARCPVFKGKLVRFDASEALKIPGVRHVFGTQPIAGPRSAGFPHHIREGVAVVADSFWAAQRGRRALKIDWDEGPNARYDTEDFERWARERAARRGDPTGHVGDPNAISDMVHAKKTLRASYVYPHQLHSCMEPLNCTAHVQGDRCEVWCGSQAPNHIIAELAALLRLPKAAIVVHLMPSGGGFGRRYYPDFAVEAAFVSQQAGRQPVKMLWTREDDQQCNLAHHFQHMEYQAALDGRGKLHAWYEKELRSYTWGASHADPELPPMAYDIPNIRYDFEDMIDDELIQSCAWRGVVEHGKALGECFIDEIAAAVGADPYQYRLALLRPGRVVPGRWAPISSDRLRSVLQLAAAKAGWGQPLGAGQGRGIAVFPYGGTCAAAVAAVTVRDRQLRIDRVTLAVDCGKVINPSGATNQLAGGIIWSLTALLHGGVPIRKGRAVRSNFHENRLLGMAECPAIDVHLLPSRDPNPSGIGEISAPLGVPAVLNAIYAATGKRIRRIPVSADLLDPSA